MLVRKSAVVGAWLLAVAGLTSCGSDETEQATGSGTVTFTTWGETYIEDHLPAAPPAEEGFVDGWTLKYSKFLVVFRGITVADSTGATAASMPGTMLFDMHVPGSKTIAEFTGVPAKNWDKVSYEIAPADASTVAGPGVEAADLSMMAAGGFAIHVVAEATNGSQTKTLDWSFAESTEYRDCKAELDGKQTYGVVVTNGGDDKVELTIHGDHFFYDDLEAGTAKRRFDAIACADSNSDGAVTLDELASASLPADPNATDEVCRTRPVYRPGSQPVNDLGGFVQALSRTIGHYRGEGECISQKE